MKMSSGNVLFWGKGNWDGVCDLQSCVIRIRFAESSEFGSIATGIQPIGFVIMWFFARLFGRKQNNKDTQSPEIRTVPVERLQNNRVQPEPKTEPQTIEIAPPQTTKFFAIDVETANSWQGSICQIGLAIAEETGKLHKFTFLIDPEMPFDQFNTDLHGISAEHTEGALRFQEVLPKLSVAIGSAQLFQHSNFDKLAIEQACKKAKLKVPRFNWADSVAIARLAWPEFKGNGGHGLANLKKELGLSFNHHDAGEDAKAAAMVVLAAEAKTGMTFTEMLDTRPSKRQHPSNFTISGKDGGALSGHVAVFTGKLSMNRETAARIAADCGIDIKASVTKMTSIVIVGDQDLSLLAGHTKSSKHRRAEELQTQGCQIRIIGETEFLKLVEAAKG